MAKDRIDRNELADKLVQTAGAAEDPVRAMAEMGLDFLMEAEVTQKIGAELPEQINAQRPFPINQLKQHLSFLRVWMDMMHEKSVG